MGSPRSLEPERKVCAGKPGDLPWQMVPGDRPQNRIVGPAGVGDGDLAVTYGNLAFAPDEVPVECGGVAALEASQVLGEPAVEGIGDHGHDYIEVDLDQDR